MPMHQGLTRAQGDPGFFSFIGKVLKTVGGVVPVIGGALQTVGGLLDPVQQRMAQMVTRPIGLPGPRPMPVPGFTGVAQRLIPGGETGFTCPPGAACPSGMRLNKSDYFLKDGTFVAAGTRCVKSRRINPANGKAVRRAIRRENAFIGMAVKTGLVRAPRAARVRKAAGKR